MPFALLVVGLVLLVTSVRGSQSNLFALVKGDLTGPNNYIYWFVAILLIGSVGYVPRLKPISVGFLVLVVLSLFLTRGRPGRVGGGFFEKFSAALGTTTTADLPTRQGPSLFGLSLPTLPGTIIKN